MSSSARRHRTAFDLGVSAAQLLRDADGFDVAARGASDGRAYAEQQRDAAIDKACALEESLLGMTPGSAEDQAAIAVAGFMVMSRLTEHDTLDGDEAAGMQAVAVRRALAALALAAPPLTLGKLCGPGILHLIQESARAGTQDSEEGGLLLRT